MRHLLAPIWKFVIEPLQFSLTQKAGGGVHCKRAVYVDEGCKVGIFIRVFDQNSTALPSAMLAICDGGVGCFQKWSCFLITIWYK